jgi:coatomer subunit beta'
LTDLKQLALQITTDTCRKYDLALSLGDLDTALQITHTILENEFEIKWKTLGDRPLTVWRFDLANECFEKAGDLSALMLTLRSRWVEIFGRECWCVFSFPFFLAFNVLMELFVEKGQNNLAFAILLQLGDSDSTACIDLHNALLKQLYSQEPGYFFKYPHTSSTFFFLPIPLMSYPFLVEARKSVLTSKKRTKIAATIADPSSNPELFEEGWEEVLAREETRDNGMFYCFFKGWHVMFYAD